MHARLEKAYHFITQNGRPIDQARFAYHFMRTDASQDALLNTLSQYQNTDGGFGHGLEPDISAPVSNPFATELALLIYCQANVPPEHPMVQRTVAYLEQTQDETGNWRFSPEVYESPLAPWFQHWEWPSLNPSCTISGLLKELGSGSEQLHRRVEELFANLGNVHDLTGDEYYNVRPYVYYFFPIWDHPQRDLYTSGVAWWLIRQADSLDGDHFFSFVRSPESSVARLLPPTLIEQRLQDLANEQAEDGGWPSPYSNHWRGWITVQNLLVLQAFGKLD